MLQDLQGDVESVFSRVDDCDRMREIATQAGPSNVENLNFNHAPVVNDGMFTFQLGGDRNDDIVRLFYYSYEHLKKPALRSLAIAHGILLSDGNMSPGELRESTVR